MRKQDMVLKLSRTMAVALSIGALTACTKTREPSFPDGQGTDIFERSLFTDARIEVSAADQAASVSDRESVRVAGERERVPVASVDAPEALKPMFKDLQISGRRGSRHSVKLRVDRKFVTAYRVASASDELSTQERQLAVREGESHLLVPMFQLAVKGYGRIVRVKNDLGEDTTTQRLEPTEWADATHVQVTVRASERAEVAPSVEDSEQVFVRDRIDGRVMRRDTFRSTFDVSLGLDDAAVVVTRIDGTNLNVYEATTISALPEGLRGRVPSVGAPGSELVRCSDAVLGELRALDEREGSDKPAIAAAADASQCVLVLRYSVASPAVAARRSVDGDGIATSAVAYHEVPAASSSIVRITRNSRPAAHYVTGDSASHLSDDLVRVSELSSGEFLMRRTLQDSPNAFDYTFAGTSGPLEIVRFRFIAGAMQVVRSRPLIQGAGSTSVDSELLMSFSARYFREERTDADGSPLATPRFVPVEYNTAENVVAMVDWASNSMPNVSSPLDYYYLEECFDGARSRTVNDVDRRIDSGHLNFTVTTTYPGSRSQDCAGIYSAGYFDSVQSNFTFAERVSFMRYAGGAETPLLSIPYEAQKRLGFGLFTYRKTVPNSFGATGVDGTEIPLPAIFDLRAGQKVTYVLAGLPEGGSAEERETREWVIQATREVVADWNQAFRRALSGTTLERSEDYLELKVEGVDIEPRRLGDLERNYLYYVQKRTEASIIGLGGAHSNPRSGKIEAASVFLYGGNIRSGIESMLQADAAMQAYLTATTPTPASSSSASGGASGGGSGSPSGSVGEPNPAAELRASLAAIRPDVERPASRARLGEGVTAHPSATLGISRFREDARRLTTIRGRSQREREEAVRDMARGLRPEEAAFHDAFQAALREKKVADTARMEQLFVESQLRHLGGSADPSVAGRLRAEAKRLSSISRLRARLEGANICVHELSEQAGSVLAASSEGMTPHQIEVGVYKSTLAHEIGHNLGLRHNFMGSFDAANWKHSADETTRRNYSSIMDYSVDDHVTYDGLGPQDVSSIRAAYAQELEVHPEVVARLPVHEGRKVIPLRARAADGTERIERIPLNQDRFIRLTDYKRVTTGSSSASWLGFSDANARRLPLKPYAFCSDEDVGFTPVCNRFDRGTTPQEIVEASILDYKAYYAIRNFPGNRLRFGFGQTGSYIGRLFQRFIAIRQFLDETFYQAITGGDQETINAYLEAAVRGLMFFHEVVRTPDAPGFIAPEERFVEVDGPRGTKVVVERKWLKSVVADMVSDRLAVRGVELDKIIALIMLTERELGMMRYEEVSLRVSYPQLEKIIGLTLDETSPDGLFTIALLKEIMQDNLMPATTTREGQLVGVDGPFKADASESLRIYAILGSMISLDVDGLELADNFSAMFRVNSGYRAPRNTTWLMQAGASSSSAGELRYWAFDEAVAAKGMISQAQLIDRIGTGRDELVADLKAWMLKKVELDSLPAAPAEGALAEGSSSSASSGGSETPTPPAETPPAESPAQARERLTRELAEMERALDAKLALLPQTVGPRTVRRLGSLMRSVAANAQQIQLLASALPRRVVYGMVYEMSTELEGLIKAAPIVEVALQAIPAEELGLAILGDIAPIGTIEMQRAMIFRNSQTLSQIFAMLHPEYRP